MKTETVSPITLHRSPFTSVSIRPNRHTLGLCAVLLAMWYAGASQTNGAAYLLCFLLASIAAVSVPQAWANLRHLKIRADPIRPVFAGEELGISLEGTSTSGRAHGGVWMRAGEQPPVACGEIPARGGARWEFQMKAARRGRFDAVPLQLVSRFPLGFVTATKRLTLTQRYYIYPAPHGTRPLPRSPEATAERRDGLQVEGDDFAGVRAWRVGESQRHIDWKAAARGQTLLIKQWSGTEDPTLHLAWEALPDLEPEARLSQLARWVVLAERGGSAYGLRLPGVTLEPARGEAHYHRCLRALAEYPA